MEANIMAKLEKKKVEEEKAKVEKELKDASIDDEKIYTSKCQNCHGVTGEKSAYNSARPLKDLSLEDMQESIKDYKRDIWAYYLHQNMQFGKNESKQINTKTQSKYTADSLTIQA